MSPFPGGGTIKRAPPGDIFLLPPAGMSLVWGKLVHPLTGYSIPPTKGALLVTPPMQRGIIPLSLDCSYMVLKGLHNFIVYDQQYNFGGKTTVILYATINHHVGTPKRNTNEHFQV